MREKFKNPFFILFFCVSLICFGSVSRIEAIPILTLDDGFTTKVIIDGSVAVGLVDSYLTAGTVSYLSSINGDIGSFSVSAATGTTKPEIGAFDDPDILLNNIVVSSLSGGTLTITFEETAFDTSATSLSGLTYLWGGTLLTDGFVVFKYFLDGVEFASISESAPNFSGSAFYDFGALPPAGVYSLKLVAEITHFSAGTSSFNSQINTSVVPEPATIALLGIGLAGLGGGYLRRRRRHR